MKTKILTFILLIGLSSVAFGLPYNCVSSFANYQYQGHDWHFYENAITGDQNAYHWNFGDGTQLDTVYSGTYNLQPHTFPLPGTYNVCLTTYHIDPILHDTLCSHDTCESITVPALCVASFNNYQYNGKTWHFYENALTGDQNDYHWNFGDGTQLDTTYPGTYNPQSHTFSLPGTYNVCLTTYYIDPILHDTLCSHDTCESVTVPALCVSSFNNYQYNRKTWHFYENALNGDQNAYHWNFGDGTQLDTVYSGTYNLQPHTFPTPGPFNVCLTTYYIDPVSHDTLCSHDTCQTINVPAVCVSSFAYYQYHAYNYHFYENAQTGDQNAYHWNFGDGTQLDTTYSNPYNLESHNFPGPGTYTVCLTVYYIHPVYHDTLCSHDTCYTIVVPPLCVASFASYQYNGNTWHFVENAPNGDQNAYHWNFGDGTILNTTSHVTIHTFPCPGTYNVCLTVYDIDPNIHDTLCSNYYCHTITITSTQCCVASYAYYQYQGNIWHFYENAQTGNQNTYHWIFGDGTTLDTTSQNIYHTFPGPGSYNVCLYVYDINPTTHDTLCVNYICNLITFTGAVNCVASYGYYQYQGNTWHFYENASTGNQNEYHWIFGDGTTLDTTGHFVIHTFPDTGTYYVCLVAYDINPTTHDTLCVNYTCHHIHVSLPVTCVASYVYYQLQGNTWHFYENAQTGNQNAYHWIFGDGTTLNTTLVAVSHTYPGTGTYNVCLVVYDINPTTHDTLCSSYTCHTITITGNVSCVASFAYYQYQGDTWHFYENATTGDQNSYHWVFGDGTTLNTTSQLAVHTYPGPGTYYVCLFVYDIDTINHDTLCVSHTCQSIAFTSQITCVSSFAGYQTQGNTYHFYENATSGDQNAYHWIFGDGTTLDTTAISVFHSFPGPGTYNVCLIVYDIDPNTHDTLCYNYSCQTITISNTANCVSSFAYYYYQGNNWHFIENATTGNQNMYHWVFGDGTTLDTTGHGVIHTYPSPGTYNVCLYVYDISSINHDTLCVAYSCHSITFTGIAACVSSFAYYQYQGNTWHFYENAQTGDQNTYHWNFGDGTTLDTTYVNAYNLASHTFPGPGTYNVCLTVYDIDSTTHDTLCINYSCQTITYGSVANCVASFVYYQLQGNLWHFFENASTGDQNTYHWIFGDGTTLDTTVHGVSHSYPGPGTYLVCLVVYDIDPFSHDTLCANYSCQVIIFTGTANCVSSFADYQYQGNTWHFYENATTGDQNSYYWIFGDGTTLSTTSQFVVHTYPSPGTYHVCLVVYDIDTLTQDTLCVNYTCQTITYTGNASCLASFADYNYQGNTWHFYENAQTGDQNDYHWYFGDGTSLDTTYSNAYNLEVHTFPGPGTYNVCLYVYDIDPNTHDTLCYDDTCTTIIINAIPTCVSSFAYYLYQGNYYHFYENATNGDQNAYHWIFGDGTTLDTTAISVFHSFPGPGTYHVCLVVYDIDPVTHDTLCYNYSCQTITIAGTPGCVSSFVYYQYQGNIWHFYANMQTGSQNDYHWYFGDGTQLDTNVLGVTHTFPGPGTYHVCLVVFDIDPNTHDTLCATYSCQNITFGSVATCVASFGYYLAQGNTYHFYENATSGDQNMYHWIFGDGTTLDTTGHFVFHTFPGAGTYNVCLVVYDIDTITHDTLCYNYTCHTITISGNVSCVASFGYYQYQGNTYHFYENAQTGNQNEYHWVFGDGTTLDTTGHFVFHTFPGPGTYNVCLYVYDIDSLTHDTLCYNYTCYQISVTGGTTCVASFGYYQYQGNTYHFYENATSGDQNMYHWIFGDGTTLDTTVHFVFHTFPGPGTYHVCLIVYDINPVNHDTLCYNYTCQTITISALANCISNFGYYHYTGGTYHFYENAQTGNQNRYHWDFGDGGTLDTTAQFAFHTYSVNGSYHVCLTALDVNPTTHDTLCSAINCAYINLALGIMEITQSDNQFLIYPNPADQVLIIEYSGNLANDIVTIELLSIEGKLINRIPLNKNHAQLDISSLSAGVYIIKLAGNNGTFVKRFIKE